MRTLLHADRMHTPLTDMRTPSRPLTESERAANVADAETFRAVKFDGFASTPDSQARALSNALGPDNTVTLGDVE